MEITNELKSEPVLVNHTLWMETDTLKKYYAYYRSCVHSDNLICLLSWKSKLQETGTTNIWEAVCS